MKKKVGERVPRQRGYDCAKMGKKRVVDNLCPLILFVPFLMISLFMYKTLFIVVVLTVHAWSACEINPISDMITGT